MDRLNVKEFKTRWLRGYVNPELRKLPIKSNVKPVEYGGLVVYFRLYAIYAYDMKTPCTTTSRSENFSFAVKNKSNEIVYVYDYISGKTFDRYGLSNSNNVYLPQGDYWVKILVGRSAESFSQEWQKVTVKPYTTTYHYVYGMRALLHSVISFNCPMKYYTNMILSQCSGFYGKTIYNTITNPITCDLKTVIKNSNNEEILSFSSELSFTDYSIGGRIHNGFICDSVDTTSTSSFLHKAECSSDSKYYSSKFSYKDEDNREVLGYGSINESNTEFLPDVTQSNFYAIQERKRELLDFDEKSSQEIYNYKEYTQLNANVYHGSFFVISRLYQFINKITYYHKPENINLINSEPLSENWFELGGSCVVCRTGELGSIIYDVCKSYKDYNNIINNQDIGLEEKVNNFQVVDINLPYPEALNYNNSLEVSNLFISWAKNTSLPQNYIQWSANEQDYSMVFQLRNQTQYCFSRTIDFDVDKKEMTCYYLSALPKYADDYEEYLKYLEM